VRLRRDADIDAVLTTLTTAASSAEGVHRREGVRTLVQSIGDERLTARVQFWHHPLHGVPVTSAVVVAIADALSEAGWQGTVTSTPGAPPLIPPDAV
jgi:hypothetical protein